MVNNEKISLAEALDGANDKDVFIEEIKAKYGVAKPITRQLISEVGISLPKLYDELRILGYPVPAKEL